MLPMAIFNNVSFNDARSEVGYAFIIEHNASTVLRNNIVFIKGGRHYFDIELASQSHNASNGAALRSFSPTNFKVSLNDFQSIDDAIARGPRQADGSLPVSDFLRLAKGSRLVGAGSTLGLPPTVPSNGEVVSLGAFEGP